MIKLYYLCAITAVCSVQASYLLDHDYVRTPLGDAIDKTSLKLLKEIYTIGADKNVVASPLGVMLLLSLYITGAGEGSREEITKFLGGTNSSQVEVSKIFYESAPGVVQEDYVVVSKVFQEAFIKVDEEGATAFTGVVTVPKSEDYEAPGPLEFKVDHPFAYLILYQDKIIFVGTYTH